MKKRTAPAASRLPALAAGLLFAGSAGAPAQELSTFETGLEGWETFPDATRPVALDVGAGGATEGAQGLAITQTGGGWNIAARVTWGDGSPQSDSIEAALAAGADRYLLEFDLTFLPAEIATEATWVNVSLIANSDGGLGGAWSQVDKVALWGQGAGEQTTSVKLPLNQIQLASEGWYQFHFVLNFDQGVAGDVTLFVDNFRLTETGGLQETLIFSFEDGTEQGWQVDAGGAPFTSVTNSELHATEGNRSLEVKFNEGPWSFGAVAFGVDHPALDRALFLNVDIHIPAGTPPINQMIVAVHEPDGINWQQIDVWLGGESGRTITVPLAYARTGTEPMNIYLGRATPGDVGERAVYVDNIRVLEVLPLTIEEAPFQVAGVLRDSVSSDVTLSWPSLPGEFFEIHKSPTLEPPAWTTLVAALPAAPGPAEVTTALAEAAVVAPRAFYRVAKIPPPPVFSEDFEGGQGDWTFLENGIDSVTTWELGAPLAGPPGAHSGSNVFGTDLDADFEDGIFNDTTGIALRSPAIDLAGRSALALNFWYFLEVEDGQSGGRLNILRGDDRSPVGVAPIIFSASTGEWREFTLPLPPEALEAGTIILEWEFIGADDGDPANNGAGWFIDDVSVGR